VQRRDCKNVTESLFCLKALELCLCNSTDVFSGLYPVLGASVIQTNRNHQRSPSAHGQDFFQRTHCTTRCNVSRSLIIHMWLDVLRSALPFGLTVVGVKRSEQSFVCVLSIYVQKKYWKYRTRRKYNEIFSLKKYSFVFSMTCLDLRLMI